MKKYPDAPRVNFTEVNPIEIKSTPYFLARVSNERLRREMENCAENEFYESAVIYRDELIKRGKLHLNLIY